MESPARRLSRTPELPTLHQLHALSSNDRAATRLYLGRAIAQSQYYAAILGSRWPLLELVQTSLPDTTENTIKIGSRPIKPCEKPVTRSVNTLPIWISGLSVGASMRAAEELLKGSESWNHPPDG